MSATKPIPVRLTPREAAGVKGLAKRTNLTQAEVLRRAVRYTLEHPSEVLSLGLD